MTIPDVIEKVQLLFPRKKRERDTTDRTITPALQGARTTFPFSKEQMRRTRTNLVIEPSSPIEEVEKSKISLLSPKIEVSDLEVTPI